MKVIEVVEPIPSDVPLKPVGMQGQKRQSVLPSKTASQAEIDQYTQIWEPRVVNLKTRMKTAFSRIQKVMQPHELALTQEIKFEVINDTDSSAMTATIDDHGKGTIQAELTLFWDAPDEVLVWILAHEVGHIRYRHGFNDPTAQYQKDKTGEPIVDPNSGYKSQSTGDASGLAYMQNPKKELGIDHRNKPVFTRQPDGRQVVRNEEREANAFANDIMVRMGYRSARVFEFFHKNQQEHNNWKMRNSSNRDSGQQQIDQALKQGLQLSQPALQHLQQLQSNLA